mmetsp:Transcript_5949/g.9615  ORF Transcript_5949/g.9615 Transcript_5949/m.9615 type:complete len:86 (+) Transcript_5949:148-405(+)
MVLQAEQEEVKLRNAISRSRVMMVVVVLGGVLNSHHSVVTSLCCALSEDEKSKKSSTKCSGDLTVPAAYRDTGSVPLIQFWSLAF